MEENEKKLDKLTNNRKIFLENLYKLTRLVRFSKKIGINPKML